MEYHKEAVRKKDRTLLGRGPRDLQRKQQQTVTNVTNPVEAELINNLSNQVSNLTEALSKKKEATGKMFTAEEFDKEFSVWKVWPDQNHNVIGTQEAVLLPATIATVISLNPSIS